MTEKSINEKIAWLLSLNKQHSNEFIRTRLARQLYRERFKTEVIAFKCSDGRVFVSLATGMPLGIVRPYRNVSGHFDLGWPLLGKKLRDRIDHGISNGRKSLILITYHYSKSDKNLGCAGFECDHEAAFVFSLKFHKQVNRFFGQNNQVVFPVVIGFETDTQSLIFHPQNPSGKDAVECSDSLSEDKEKLLEIIHGLYPDMDKEVKKDLMRLMEGNIAHLRGIKAKGKRSFKTYHKEWVVGIGEGFTWMNEQNTALIIGPYDPDLSKPIVKAIDIIKKNMLAGQINDDSFLVLSSAQFKEEGVDKNRACEEANFLCSYTKEIIKNNYPYLIDKARFLTVIIDERTRLLEQISGFD